ncbi:hypothetical protein [Lacticaseibacillus paracasei]|uniref:hypothetical protein n=1 Tax=Lacticaseibacillus paracasei TaxID=1597 RepID=UPI001957705C|nr:hypothetical protein [Lacticaseibacillus paracasei]
MLETVYDIPNPSEYISFEDRVMLDYVAASSIPTAYQPKAANNSDGQQVMARIIRRYFL